MEKLLKKALILSIITIVYNLAEGIISIYFGLEEEALALAGFGFDSFVEVLSGIGIFHMVMRMQNSNVDKYDKFEKTALTITGISFYLLALGITASSIIKLYQGYEPDSTVPGIIISIISLATMYFLMSQKLKTGKALKSDAIIADANCTRTCFNLSIVLLVSSLLYYFFRINYIDVIGSLIIAYYAYKEGKESLVKVKIGNISCACDH